MVLAPRGALLLGAALSACSLQDVSALNRCTGRPDSADCPLEPGGSSGTGGSATGGSSSGGSEAGGLGGGDAGAGPEPIRLRAQYAYPPPDPPTSAELSKAIRADLQIINDSPFEIPLSEISLRYYYTSEGAPCSEFSCLSVNRDSVVNDCGGIGISFQSYASASGLANAYWELSFTSDRAAGWVLGANGGASGNIKLQAFKPKYASQDLTNDYSFDEKVQSLTDWPNITLHRGSVLLFGTPP